MTRIRNRQLVDIAKDSKLTADEKSEPFSSEVYRAHKKEKGFKLDDSIAQKYKNVWYLKKVGDAKTALREVLTQEYFRLIIGPHHPKTRIVKGSGFNNTYIISKEVNGYQPLLTIDPKKFKEGLSKGKHPGLGEILAVSLNTNEIDLHLGNIGLDKDGNAVKIDGGNGFSKLGGKKANYSITEQDISTLPYITTYSPVNWLDLITQSKNNPTSQYFDTKLSTDPIFRQEINCAILKMIILPDELLAKFSQSYSDNKMDAVLIYKEMISRTNELEKFALQNKSFNEFLKDPNTKKYLASYIDQLKGFNTTSKNKILSTDFMKQIDEKFESLSGQTSTKDKEVTATQSADESMQKLYAAVKKTAVEEKSTYTSSTNLLLNALGGIDSAKEKAINTSSNSNNSTTEQEKDPAKDNKTILTIQEGDENENDDEVSNKPRL